MKSAEIQASKFTGHSECIYAFGTGNACPGPAKWGRHQ